MPSVKTTGCLVVCTAWLEPERTDFFFVLVVFQHTKSACRTLPFHSSPVGQETDIIFPDGGLCYCYA